MQIRKTKDTATFYLHLNHLTGIRNSQTSRSENRGKEGVGGGDDDNVVYEERSSRGERE